MSYCGLSGDDGLTDIFTGDVPCNGCTACCRADGPRLLDTSMGDDPARYKTRSVGVDEKTGEPVHALQIKANGDCIYLGSTGCTIWPDQPHVCRSFDCRALYTMLTPAERAEVMTQNGSFADIFRAAGERV